MLFISLLIKTVVNRTILPGWGQSKRCVPYAQHFKLWVTTYYNTQLRTAIVKIVSTPGRRQLFREKAKQYYSLATRRSKKGVITQVSTLMPVRDVRTRWNSTHAMIKRACILRKVSQYNLLCNCWQLILSLGCRLLAL